MSKRTAGHQNGRKRSEYPNEGISAYEYICQCSRKRLQMLSVGDKIPLFDFRHVCSVRK